MSCYLALDTATEACSAALWLDGAVSERFEVVERDHTRRLLPMVQALLREAGRPASRLDGIACGIGPGSFAGVRIGVGVVKGLALAADIPVVGVSSLAMLAQQAVRETGATQVAAVIDARLQEVYAGIYAAGAQGRVEPVMPDRVCRPGEVSPLAAGPWVGVGSGWAAHPEALQAAFGVPFTRIVPKALPHAADALWLARPALEAGQGVSADSLVPAYLRDKVALTLKQQRALRE